MQQQQTLDTFIRGGRALSPPRAPEVCRLGVLGHRKDLTQDDVKQIMDLIVEDFPTIQSMHLPSDGDTSIYIEICADGKLIPCTLYEADWRRDGRRAQIFRDARILRESTHFLIFGAPRSEKPYKTAEQLVKKHHVVYYIPHGTMELQQLEAPVPVQHQDK
jgi:hypothetical protein